MAINHWSRYYDLSRDKLAQPHPEIIGSIQSLIGTRGVKILEVGAGRGADSIEFAKGGAYCVTVDNSEVAAEIAMRNTALQGASLSVLRADAFKLPFKDNIFDVVFHQGFLEHFREPQEIITEQLRVLRPGGYILVDAPERFNFWTVKKRILSFFNLWFAGWETSFTRKSLCRLLSDSGFKIHSFYRREYYPGLFRMFRNMRKIEQKLGFRILPARAWDSYERLWRALEKCFFGAVIFKAVGVIAQKP